MSVDKSPVLPRGLGDFLGVWCVTRHIRQDDGTLGRFEGRAEWRLDGEGALYLETGQLWLGGQGPFTAARRTLWDADLGVRFEDGRPFHRVPLQGGPVNHWCPPDQYDGHYVFDTWPCWQVTWHVSGPRKAYVSQTEYRTDRATVP